MALDKKLVIGGVVVAGSAILFLAMGKKGSPDAPVYEPSPPETKPDELKVESLPTLDIQLVLSTTPPQLPPSQVELSLAESLPTLNIQVA